MQGGRRLLPSIDALEDELFDFRPSALIADLGLLTPNGWNYRDSAAYGHFGRPQFPWEKTDKIDARKGLEMFRTINVPILGIVENMSTFICPHCGEASHIFSHGGAAATAKELGVPFLGEIPLNMALRISSDEGKPIMAAADKTPEAMSFMTIAEKVHQAIT